MNNEFEMKTLKLLADPNKLKGKKVNIPSDRLKLEIEVKFNYRLNNTTYQHILETIRTELVIDALLNDIINQVTLNHNP